MIIKTKLDLGLNKSKLQEKNIQTFEYIAIDLFDYEDTLSKKKTYQDKLIFITDNHKELLIKYYRNGYGALTSEEQDFIDDYLAYTKEEFIMKIEHLQIDELRYLKKLLGREIDKMDITPNIAEVIKSETIKKIMSIENKVTNSGENKYRIKEFELARRIYQKVVKSLHSYKKYQRKLLK